VPESVRQKAYANLPPLVRQTLEEEARLREMLTQGTSSYEELEKVALRFGDTPRGEGSRDVPEGRWSYYPDGYFVRYLPTGYPQTRIIAYLPEPFTVERTTSAASRASQTPRATASRQLTMTPSSRSICLPIKDAVAMPSKTPRGMDRFGLCVAGCTVDQGMPCSMITRGLSGGHERVAQTGC